MNHTVKTRDGGLIEIKNYQRALAVKLMCTECLGWGEENPANCDDKLCPLFPYRKITQKAYHSKDKEL